jgi:hypothetical protein
LQLSADLREHHTAEPVAFRDFLAGFRPDFLIELVAVVRCQDVGGWRHETLRHGTSPPVRGDAELRELLSNWRYVLLHPRRAQQVVDALVVTNVALGDLGGVSWRVMPVAPPGWRAALASARSCPCFQKLHLSKIRAVRGS